MAIQWAKLLTKQTVVGVDVDDDALSLFYFILEIIENFKFCGVALHHKNKKKQKRAGAGQ